MIDSGRATLGLELLQKLETLKSAVDDRKTDEQALAFGAFAMHALEHGEKLPPYAVNTAVEIVCASLDRIHTIVTGIGATKNDEASSGDRQSP